jgi:hypothetical protein
VTRSTVRTLAASQSNQSGVTYFNGKNLPDNLVDMKNDMMVNWLYEQQLRKQWASGLDSYEGVVLKKSRGDFICCPHDMAEIEDSLLPMATRMNVRVAMTVNTPVVRTILRSVRQNDPDKDNLPLPGGLRVQILNTMADLPKSRLHHFAALIKDVGMLVVWADEAEEVLTRGKDLENRFMEVIWGKSGEEEEENEKEKVDYDAELAASLPPEERKIRLESAFVVAGTLALCITCLGLGWRAIAYEITVDGDWTRIAFVLLCPIQIFISLVSGMYYRFFLPPGS